jgi:NAD(P)-dependent dehydrogenase (short-subunit alcohol dehydrogenase family)
VTDSPAPDRRVAVVTGAGRGIGEATATKLARDGFTTVGIDIQRPPDFSQHEWELVECDIADEAAVQGAVDDIARRYGRIDVLANIAGIVLVKPLVETGWDEFLRLVEVNLGGTFLMSKHALRLMQPRKAGVIINLGSVSGHVGQIDHSLYGASKGGVIALTRALAWELAPYGIRVVSVSPGSVDTPMLRGDIELEAQRTGLSFEEVKRLREGEQALGRWADPSEIAEAISFLASDRASFITGSDHLVDCGWVAR